MPIRPAALLATAAAFGFAGPAFAQVDDRYVDIETEVVTEEIYCEAHARTDCPLHGEHHAAHHGGQYTSHDGSYDGNWEGRWEAEDRWIGDWTGTYTDAQGRQVEAEYSGVWMGDAHFMSEDGRVLTHDGHGGWREHHRSNAHAPGLGYTTEQRNQWLAECRYLMAGGGGYYDDRYDRGGNGGLIGGVLGAVVGGVAGNRIADGDRLLGTVVGAGLGGIAGAAIGSAVDGDGDYDDLDREELWAARYCEAYLARHEMGAGYGYAQPMMMAPVRAVSMRRPTCSRCEEEVIIEEEVVEIERPARRVVPRRPARSGGKRTPIN
ncbi:glycine zipper 2TM domain-containing protein [Aurantiacibacter sp. MUD61]|uniref:glycine zipper 2TM domain-containing protein n=1 Tax=Aurantiacibacter sp. MUD61 TaxID=3009083 RepID=UPI0022F08EA6|nr:glycine zipper 2TM domain-containing protein [Aurantiacibacter sp. MUD61]